MHMKFFPSGHGSNGCRRPFPSLRRILPLVGACLMVLSSPDLHAIISSSQFDRLKKDEAKGYIYELETLIFAYLDYEDKDHYNMQSAKSLVDKWCKKSYPAGAIATYLYSGMSIDNFYGFTDTELERLRYASDHGWSKDYSKAYSCLCTAREIYNMTCCVERETVLKIIKSSEYLKGQCMYFGIGGFSKDLAKAEELISRYGSGEEAAKVRKAATENYLNGMASDEEALRYFVAHRDKNNTDVIVKRMVSRCNDLESLTKVNTTVQRILFPEGTKFENAKEYYLLTSPAHVYIAQCKEKLTNVKGYPYYKTCKPAMQKALDRFVSERFKSYEYCLKNTGQIKDFYSTYPNKAVVASVRNGITGSLDARLAQDDDLANLVDLYRIAEKLVSEDVVNPLDNMKVLENNIKKKAKSTISSKSKSLWQSYMHNGTDDKRAWNSLVQDLDGAIKYVKDCLPEMYSVIVTQDDINFLAQSSELPAVRESFGREATGDDPFPTLRKHLATYPDSNYSILLKTTYEQLCDTYAKERAMKLSRSSSDAEKQTVKNLAKTDIGKDMISRFVDNGLATKDKYDKKGLHYTFDDIAYGNIPVELARRKEMNKPSVHFGLDLEWYTHGFKDRGFLIGPAMTLCLKNCGLAADLAVALGSFPYVHSKEDKSVIFANGVCVPVSLRYTMFGSVYVSAGALLQKPLNAGYCSLSDETVKDMEVANPFAVSPKVSLGLLYDDDYVTEFEFGCCFDSSMPLLNYEYIQSSGIEALISPENFAKQKSDMRFFITYRYYF